MCCATVTLARLSRPDNWRRNARSPAGATASHWSICRSLAYWRFTRPKCAVNPARRWRSAGAAVLHVAALDQAIQLHRASRDLGQQFHHSLLHQRGTADGPLAAHLAALHAAGKIHFLRAREQRERSRFPVDSAAPNRRAPGKTGRLLRAPQAARKPAASSSKQRSPAPRSHLDPPRARVRQTGCPHPPAFGNSISSCPSTPLSPRQWVGIKSRIVSSLQQSSGQTYGLRTGKWPLRTDGC
jgi:hypothetical protein